MLRFKRLSLNLFIYQEDEYHISPYSARITHPIKFIFFKLFFFFRITAILKKPIIRDRKVTNSLSSAIQEFLA